MEYAKIGSDRKPSTTFPNLKTGMVVVRKDGRKFIVFKDVEQSVYSGDVMVELNGETWGPLNEYYEHKSSFGEMCDIIRVEVPRLTCDTVRQIIDEKNGVYHPREVIWEPKNEEVKKVKAVISKLEKDLEAAKKQLEVIKKS